MLALLAMSMTLPADHHEEAASPREYYTLVVYENDDVERGKKTRELIDTKIAPIVRSFDGVSKVGVFTEASEQPKNAEPTGNVYLLAACSDVRTATMLTDKLAASDEAQAAFRSVDWPLTDKAKVTYMIAFAGIPQIELPKQTAAGEDRVFEMRTYYSGDSDLARLKMEMFDEGEIDLMRDVNLQPVFYGSALVSADEDPHLVYLLSAGSVEEHKTNWQGFLDSPVWNEMKGNPRYKGTVSKIEQVFLVPTESSDI